jgi:hypothetical protein
MNKASYTEQMEQKHIRHSSYLILHNVALKRTQSHNWVKKWNKHAVQNNESNISISIVIGMKSHLWQHWKEPDRITG